MGELKIYMYCISMEGAGEGEQRVLWGLLHQNSGGKTRKNYRDGNVEAKNGENAFGFQHQIIKLLIILFFFYFRQRRCCACLFHVLK